MASVHQCMAIIRPFFLRCADDAATLDKHPLIKVLKVAYHRCIADPSAGGYHGGGAMKHHEGGANKSAHFVRGVTPSRTERQVTGSREGASGDGTGAKKPVYPQVMHP